MQLAPAEDDRPKGLDQRCCDREPGDRDPDGRAHFRDPAAAHSEAAMIGTPAGATGVSSSPTAAPSRATTLTRGLRRSGTSSPRKKAGEIASRPSAFGSPMMPPPKAPRTVPPT